jgi:uncharacterized RDD family membrane protein YckC
MQDGLTLTAALGIFVLPAAVFAVLYPLMVTRLARGLVSPYPKADLDARLHAAAIDSMIVTTMFALSWTSSIVLYLVAGAGYLLLRDGIKGQSLGKFLLGLVVISLDTGRPATFAGSVRRNLLLLLPGANVVAVVLEARTIVRDPQGQRLGDKLAQTQVVAGFGAKDLVKAFEQWLIGLGTGLDRASRGRSRAHVRNDRAA